VRNSTSSFVLASQPTLNFPCEPVVHGARHKLYDRVPFYPQTPFPLCCSLPPKVRTPPSRIREEYPSCEGESSLVSLISKRHFPGNFSFGKETPTSAWAASAGLPPEGRTYSDVFDRVREPRNKSVLLTTSLFPSSLRKCSPCFPNLCLTNEHPCLHLP